MKHRCVVCKKEKGTKGLSFHRFPKDEKQLCLWLKNLEKENCTPSPTSLVCSRHFEPECLQSVYKRVRLEKGSIPTIFTEQDHASTAFEPLTDSEIHVLDIAATSSEDAIPYTVIEPLIESHDSYTESSEIHILEIAETNSKGTTPCTVIEPLIESHGSCTKSSKIHALEIAEICSKDTTPCTVVKPLIKPHSSYTESSEMHVSETTGTNHNGTIPYIETTQQVQHDHQYTYTPTSYRKKLLEMQKYIRELRNSKRVLEQKVKRLQRTVASLKKVYYSEA